MMLPLPKPPPPPSSRNKVRKIKTTECEDHPSLHKIDQDLLDAIAEVEDLDSISKKG